MPKVRIVPAEAEPFDHEIEGDSIVIGRSSRCDLAVADRSLSRQHLRIYKSGDVWMVEDLGSRNGTYLNGELISEPRELRLGDSIGASDSYVIFGGLHAVRRETEEADSKTVYRAAREIIADSERELALPTVGARDELERATAQLRVLNDVHQALAGATTIEELFEEILDRVFAHLRPENAAVFVKDGDRIIRTAVRSAPGSHEEFPESTSLASEVIGKGLAAVVHDTATDVRFAGADSLLAAGVRTLIAAPLLTPEGALGMIVLCSTLAERQFAESDMEMLVMVASATGLRLRNLALAEEAAERRRFEREVQIARRIQVALLPSSMPEIDGIELYGGNTPSRGVSGDYYQIIELEEPGEVALVVADVSGKGIGASLLTGYVDALVNAYLGEGLEPAEIFSKVSPQMNSKTPAEAFATAFLGIFSVATGEIRFSSAGHDPAILVRSSGDVDLLNPTGMPLGLLPEATYDSASATLEPGDSLVLYTDGITEAAKADDSMFERERLVEVCREHREESPEMLARSIHTAVEAFVEGEPYHDDRTLLILKRVG